MIRLNYQQFLSLPSSPQVYRAIALLFKGGTAAVGDSVICAVHFFKLSDDDIAAQKRFHYCATFDIPLLIYFRGKEK